MTKAIEASSIKDVIPHSQNTTTDNSTSANHCVCMSGITQLQLTVITLYGALQGLEWRVVQVVHATAGPPPLGNPELNEYMLKLQLGIVRAQAKCLEAAYPRGVQ